MKPSKYDWKGKLEKMLNDEFISYNEKDGLYLLSSITDLVSPESYNESFNYIERELDEIESIDIFLNGEVNDDDIYDPVTSAHISYHKMFRQIDVFYNESHISDDRRIPIDTIFYNFIRIGDYHWNFFKRAVFSYVCERDKIDEEWIN